MWARVAGFATADLDGELYEKRWLVKQLAMRRTLWLVRAADLPALQTAAATRSPMPKSGDSSPTSRRPVSQWTVGGGWTTSRPRWAAATSWLGPGRAARQALQVRASELTEWLNGVRVSPRFPSPLSKTVPA